MSPHCSFVMDIPMVLIHIPSFATHYTLSPFTTHTPIHYALPWMIVKMKTDRMMALTCYWLIMNIAERNIANESIDFCWSAQLLSYVCRHYGSFIVRAVPM